MKLITGLSPFKLYGVNHHECTASRCMFEARKFKNDSRCTAHCVWTIPKRKVLIAVDKYNKLQEALHANGEN